MNILITGGSGFLGARLARTLLALGALAPGGEAARPIERITLVDGVASPPGLQADPRIASLQGDLGALIESGALTKLLTDAAVVFHLAAAVSGECEADFDLGLRSNLDATRALLDAARHAARRPVFVFPSSVAVFGHAPEHSRCRAGSTTPRCRRRKTATASRNSSASSWWPTTPAKVLCAGATCA